MEDKIKNYNPTLHRYLFTVTAFSKFLAMFFFILFPFVGFYLGMQYQEIITLNIPVVSQIQENKPRIKIVPTAILEIDSIKCTFTSDRMHDSCLKGYVCTLTGQSACTASMPGSCTGICEPNTTPAIKSK